MKVRKKKTRGQTPEQRRNLDLQAMELVGESPEDWKDGKQGADPFSKK